MFDFLKKIAASVTALRQADDAFMAKDMPDFVSPVDAEVNRETYVRAYW